MTAVNARIAIFWDKSFLWGLIAYDTFRELGIGFDLLTAADIRGGALRADAGDLGGPPKGKGYDVLLVPGGWASDKIKSLGGEGVRAIRTFVSRGGSYLGFCGGAGLALRHASGLALVEVSRLPSSVRVPSFSGPIRLRQEAPDHPMWKGISGDSVFHAWWPGQFSLEGAGADVEVLARYGEPEAGSFVTDLPVLPGTDWAKWEGLYGINLNPGRLAGEPAVIEGRFGNGKVFLSYPHFETPGDKNGKRVLLNILEYLAGGKRAGKPCGPAQAAVTGENQAASPHQAAGEDNANLEKAIALTKELKNSADELVAFGLARQLWFRRNEWILQWRRGVRGVEYSTLYAMLDRLYEVIAAAGAIDKSAAAAGATDEDAATAGAIDESTAKAGAIDERTVARLERLREKSEPFFREAPRLLKLEGEAMAGGPINPLKTDDERIAALREKLFSSSKRCGGLYEEIISLADEILLPLLAEY